MKKIKLLFFLLLSLSANGIYAQQLPFYNEISQFKIDDRMHPPPPHPILFVGSSSFTKWTDMQKYFPGYPVLNRGFGGSSLPDLIRYVKDVIYTYNPKQVVIYCGDNDFAASDTVSVQTVFNRFKELFHLIRKKFPEVPVVYVSIKPSPSREKLMPKMAAENKMIKDYLKTQKYAAFADVYNKMLDDNGKPIDDIFIEDKLHMNSKGYGIWQKVLLPYLVK